MMPRPLESPARRAMLATQVNLTLEQTDSVVAMIREVIASESATANKGGNDE
jgi:hypothetical protein